LRDWKAWAGVTVSAFLLWWVFRGQDLGAIAEQAALADPLLLVVTATIITAGGLVRAVRWRFLLEPLGSRVPLGPRWKAIQIGMATTNLALGRLGELARPYALSRMVPVTMSGALGTVVLERVIDMVVLAVLLALVLASPALPADTTIFGRPVGYAAGGAVAVSMSALAILLPFVLSPDRVILGVAALGRRMPRPLGDRMCGAVESFASGINVLRSPVALLGTLIWSFVLWIWMAGSFWVAFHAFDIDLPFAAALFTQSVVAIFVAIPAGPGFVGTLQAGVVAAVSGVFGVPAATALSMSLGYHLSGYIPVTLLGLYYAWSLRIRGIRMERSQTPGTGSEESELRGLGPTPPLGARAGCHRAKREPSPETSGFQSAQEGWLHSKGSAEWSLNPASAGSRFTHPPSGQAPGIESLPPRVQGGSPRHLRGPPASGRP